MGDGWLLHAEALAIFSTVQGKTLKTQAGKIVRLGAPPFIPEQLLLKSDPCTRGFLPKRNSTSRCARDCRNTQVGQIAPFLFCIASFLFIQHYLVASDQLSQLVRNNCLYDVFGNRPSGSARQDTHSSFSLLVSLVSVMYAGIVCCNFKNCGRSCWIIEANLSY